MAGLTGIVHGKNCVFQVNFGSGYLPIVCAKSFSVNVQTGIKETTSRGSGVWQEFDYDSLSYKVSLSGLIKVVDADGDPIFFDLFAYQTGFLPLPFKAIFTDDNAVVKQLRGTAIINTSMFSASAGQLADSTIDLQGTGEVYLESDTALGCSNSISGVTINTLSVSEGATIAVIGSNDLYITIDSLANPALEIFRYDFEIGGYGRNSVFTDGSLPYAFPLFDLSGIPNGSYPFAIYPVCDNGFDGNAWEATLIKSPEIPP